VARVDSDGHRFGHDGGTGFVVCDHPGFGRVDNLGINRTSRTVPAIHAGPHITALMYACPRGSWTVHNAGYGRRIGLVCGNQEGVR